MKVPRFRVSSIMGFVAIVALKFGAIRALSDFKTSHSHNEHVMLMIDEMGTGVIPMANILAIVRLISLRRRGSCPFLLGFEAFGATALALYTAGVIFFTEELVWPYANLALKPLAKTIGPFVRTGDILALISVAVVMFVLPQVALALIGGFIFRKFRIAAWADSTRC